MISQDHARFRSLFDGLMGYALNRGVRFEEAQDLVGASIEAAYRSYDPARGAFAALCQTALSNRIKNHWRDRKPMDPLPDGDGIADPDGDHGFADDPGEDAAQLEAIMSKLTESEKQFLIQMRQVLEEYEDRAVSETSRRLGIEPAKGWDIFRRIQRKARRAEPPAAHRLRAAELPPAPLAAPDMLLECDHVAERGDALFSMSPKEWVPDDVRSLARFVAVHAAFENVIATLDDDACASIEALL